MINRMMLSFLNRAVLFLLNKEIDMLYSLSTSADSSAQQQVGQFSVNSIRMKSNLGLAGKAYSSGKIAIEGDAAKQGGTLIAEEKDLTKLKVKNVTNAVAVPVLDKQNGAPLAVIMAYNYDVSTFTAQNLEEGQE
jgi:hypothetical protein